MLTKDPLNTTCTKIGTCAGGCGDAIRRSSRFSWHITLGHPGFNSPTNNTPSGYLSYGKALAAMTHYSRKTEVAS